MFGDPHRYDAALARISRRLDAQERLLAMIAETAGVPADEVREALSATEAAPQDVLAALRAGRKIEAIKLYRQHTGAGLKAAKDAVDAMENEL